MNSVLSEFLKGEVLQIRAGSEVRKADKLDWQRATQELVERILSWITAADPDGVLQYRRTEHSVEDYDGSYSLKGLALILGDATVQMVPSKSPVVGSILIPGEDRQRRIAGRVEFDNGTDRIPLYRVKDGDRDVWLWWSHGGVGKLFDRESFEATIVSLLR